MACTTQGDLPQRHSLHIAEFISTDTLWKCSPDPGMFCGNNTFFHPLSLFPFIGSQGCGWSLEPAQAAPLGMSRGTPWRRRQLTSWLTSNDRFTPDSHSRLRSPIHPSPKRRPTERERTHTIIMQTPHRKAPGPPGDSNQEPSSCEATVLTTAWKRDCLSNITTADMSLSLRQRS